MRGMTEMIWITIDIVFNTTVMAYAHPPFAFLVGNKKLLNIQYQLLVQLPHHKSDTPYELCYGFQFCPILNFRLQLLLHRL